MNEPPPGLDSIAAFILDLDGVVYRGQAAIPGAAEFLDYLDGQSLPFTLVTNNATRSPHDHRRRLSEMGVSVSADQILTSATATALYLERQYPTGARVFMIGESGLRTALYEAGFELAQAEVQAVVVGMDRDVTYSKLKTATILIRNGAQFVGTNPDLTFPSEEGLVPGAGAILAAVEAATGVAPIVVGKPEPLLFQQALERMNVEPGRAAVIGDRIETDVFGGRAAGLTTILVLTGAARREDLVKAEVTPDHVLESLAELHSALSSLHGERGNS